MAAGKEVRKKIKATKNTQKITKAMEMVAASKMRRTQERMRRGRPYAEKIRNMIGHLANSNPEYRHVYMQEREVKRVGYIVVSTDKGLCGGLNINLFRALVKELQQHRANNVGFEFALIGNKAAAFFRSYGGQVNAALNNLGDVPTVESLIGGIRVMLDAYAKGNIDRLYIATNEFVNTMTQKAIIRQLLPLPPTQSDELKHRWDYLYEPDARDLIDGLVTRFIESQVYQSVIENQACEQAAKMIAMKNATENADQLIDDLTLLYNNVRQAAITREISEIVGGAAAV
ncbi:MAG TPA: F0F1 ATP synthase subunit gamma [Pseudomonadales bacterium]|nr:F0F1 ATP synthase subunit gamma [Pseudomonadales bacterium]